MFILLLASGAPSELAVGFGSLLHLAVSLVVIAHVLWRPREPRGALLWIFFVCFFPFFGAVAYVLFGINTVPKKEWARQYSDAVFAEHQSIKKKSAPLIHAYRARNALLLPPDRTGDPPFNRMLDLLEPEHPLLDGNDIRLIESAGQALEEMFAAVRSARHHIHLATYILAKDVVGRRLMTLLAERAKAGVRVKVLYDAFGSAAADLRGFFRPFRRIPNLSLVAFSQSNIFKRQFQLNLRNHRKILIVDGALAFTGGVNFHDVYLPGKDGAPGTVDYHFSVRGPLVIELQYSFLRDWFYMTDTPLDSFLAKEFYPPPSRAGGMAGRVLDSTPAPDKATAALNLFFAAVSRASKSIRIATPYFVPPESLLIALCQAAARGVDVRILVPQANNHPTIRLASHALYRQLLLAGVGIYERRPPFIHAKAAVFDERFSIIGSANWDPRSLALNYETNILVESPEFSQTLEYAMRRQFLAADRVDFAGWERRPRRDRLVENFFNLFHPIA